MSNTVVQYVRGHREPFSLEELTPDTTTFQSARSTTPRAARSQYRRDGHQTFFDQRMTSPKAVSDSPTTGNGFGSDCRRRERGSPGCPSTVGDSLLHLARRTRGLSRYDLHPRLPAGGAPVLGQSGQYGEREQQRRRPDQPRGGLRARPAIGAGRVHARVRVRGRPSEPQYDGFTSRPATFTGEPRQFIGRNSATSNASSRSTTSIDGTHWARGSSLRASRASI